MTNPGQQAPTPRDGERRKLLGKLLGKRVGATVAAAGELPVVKAHIGTELIKNGREILKPGSEILGIKSAKDGSYSSLRGVVQAGGNMIAIVERRKEGGGTLSYSVVRTGLGINARGGQPTTGVVIAEVSQKDLLNPGQDGVVQPWRTINIGRTDLNGDPEASRQHFSVTFNEGGDIGVTDGWIDERNHRAASGPSLNGTSVLQGEHFGYLSQGQQYDPQDLAVYNTLAHNAYVWDPTAIGSLPPIASGKHVPSIGA
ncbi:MAG: hypothetical protein WAQ24_02195 [Candidatus Saccharimonadales bacterium]